MGLIDKLFNSLDWDTSLGSLLSSLEPLQFEPGSRWSYSNSGFMVLGAIIEKVSGQNYFDYIREHVYKLAGMINSDAYELDRETPNLAMGYTHSVARFSGSESSSDTCIQKPELIKPTDGEWRNNIFMHVLKGGPAGGGYSTVEDLLRFATALTNHKLLTPKFNEIVLTGKVDAPDYSVYSVGTKYAYGFVEERMVNAVSVTQVLFWVSVLDSTYTLSLATW